MKPHWCSALLICLFCSATARAQAAHDSLLATPSTGGDCLTLHGQARGHSDGDALLYLVPNKSSPTRRIVVTRSKNVPLRVMDVRLGRKGQAIDVNLTAGTVATRVAERGARPSLARLETTTKRRALDLATYIARKCGAQ